MTRWVAWITLPYISSFAFKGRFIDRSISSLIFHELVFYFRLSRSYLGMFEHHGCLFPALVMSHNGDDYLSPTCSSLRDENGEGPCIL